MKGASFVRGTPVVCDSCGFRGRLPGLIGGNATNINLAGNLVSCPRCPAMARIVDGTYDLQDNVFHWKAGPTDAWRDFAQILADEQWTREQAEKVLETLESSKAEDSPEAIAEDLGRNAPGLREWALKVLRDPATTNLLRILSMVLRVLLAEGVFDSAERLVPDDVTRLIQEYESQQPTSGSTPAPESQTSDPSTPTATDDQTDREGPNPEEPEEER